MAPRMRSWSCHFFPGGESIDASKLLKRVSSMQTSPKLTRHRGLECRGFPRVLVCRGRVPSKSQPALLLIHRQGRERSQEPYPKAKVSQNSFSGWFQLWCSASHLVATCRTHGQLQQLRCELSLTISMFPLAGADRRIIFGGGKKKE